MAKAKKRKYPKWAKGLLIIIALIIGVEVADFTYNFTSAYVELANAATSSKKQLGVWDYIKNAIIVGSLNSQADNLDMAGLVSKSAKKQASAVRKQASKTQAKSVKQIKNNKNYTKNAASAGASSLDSLSSSQRASVLYRYFKSQGVNVRSKKAALAYYKEYYGSNSKRLIRNESDALKLKSAMSTALGSQNSATQKLNSKLTSAKRTQQKNNQGGKTTSQNDTLYAAQKMYDAIWKGYSDLSASKKAKVNKQMKKKGYSSVTKKILQTNESLYSKKNKAVTKYYKTLYSVASKYMSKADKEKIQKQAANSNDTNMARKVEQESEPTTFWGKIGKALINAFWASAIGKWLKQNSAGAVIFAGATSVSNLKSILASNPLQSIYSDSNDETMTQVASYLTPAMIAAGIALLILAVIINTTKMGVGTVMDPVRSRLQWYHSMVDLAIAAVGVVGYAALINTIIEFNNALLMGFANFMNSITPVATTSSLFNSALTLGFNESVATAITKGTILGESFAGVIFCIIYLLAYIGLAVFVKYYYLMRAIVFTILLGIGPIFIALWSLDWGKRRTFAWLQDMLGTVFIQNVHALTLTFMALFMDWNNQRIIDSIGTSSAKHASAFGAMVFGFIIMIIFQPVSKSLAALFGMSTNMLDNTFQSTSRVMQAAGLATAGALIGSAKVGANVAGGLTGAGKAAVGAAKTAKGASKGMRAKAAMSAFKNTAAKNKVGLTAMSGINGVVGKSVGQLAGLAAGAGGGSQFAALSLSKAGGEIGKRAAELTSKPLASIGLKRAQKRTQKMYKAQEQARRNGIASQVDDKVDSGLTKDAENRIKEDDNPIREDKNAGLEKDHDTFVNNYKKHQQDLKKDPNNAELQKLVRQDRDKLHALEAQRRNFQDAQAQKKKLLKDPNAVRAIAQQQMNTTTSGSYVRAGDMKDAARNVMTEKELTALSGEGKEADKIEKSLALGGAQTSGAVIQSVSDQDIATARDKAKREFRNTYGHATSAAKAQALKYGYVKSDGSADLKKWTNSPEYQGGMKKAMDEAGMKAAMTSNGAVLKMDKPIGKEDIAAFENSQVNADVVVKDLNAQMAKSGAFTPERIAEIDSALEGMKNKSGQSLVSETQVPGMNTAVKTVNAGLYHTMAEQTAKSFNSAERFAGQDSKTDPANKFTAADFEALHTDEYNPSGVMGSKDQFNVNDFKDYLASGDNSASLINRANYVAKQNASTYARFAAESGAEVADMFNVSRLGLGIGGNKNNTAAGDGIFGGRTIADTFSNGYSGIANDPKSDVYAPIYSEATKSIASYDRNSMIDTTPSISDEISRMQIAAAKDNLTSIPEGSFQLVTKNGGSYIQAKDPDYGWVQIGQFGNGDISLGAGESIIQDLSYNSDTNTIGPAFDATSRQVSQPYSMVDGVKVPHSYSSGTQPDLSALLKNYGKNYFDYQTDMTDYTKMATSDRAQGLYERGMLSVDKLTAGEGGYDSFKYYSDGAHQTIIGHRKNAPAGSFENLIPNYKDGSFLQSAVSGVQYSIDLVPTDNGLGVTDKPNIGVYSQGSHLSDQQRKGIMDSVRSLLDNEKERKGFTSQLNGIIPQTDEVMQNRLTRNSPPKDVNNLCTYS